MTQEQSGFAITQNKGFVMRFKNGLTISVQFGYGNYCDNKNHPGGYNFQEGQKMVRSSNAEIAIWDAESNWFQFANDQVEGFVTPDEVGMWIEAIMMSESLNDLQTIAEESGLVEKILNQK